MGDGCHVGNLPIVRPFQFGAAPWPLFNSCSFQQSMSTISSQELRLPKESIGGNIELSEKEWKRTILRIRTGIVVFKANREFRVKSLFRRETELFLFRGRRHVLTVRNPFLTTGYQTEGSPHRRKKHY